MIQTKKMTLIMVGVLSLFQIIVIVSLLYRGESAGRVVPLRCAIYDPYEPIGGRYLQLSFDVERVAVSLYRGSDLKELSKGDQLYLILSREGDALELTRERPGKYELFIEIEFQHADPETIYLRMPFKRFYVQENLAVEADRVIRMEGDKHDIYAEIKVSRKGKANIKELYVDTIALEKYVSARLKEKKE
jgi:uncharacterized membrane-anchored protein